MNNQTRKFFIYTRKSTDTEDRQVRSISDQLAELKELAVKEQIEVVDIFVEKQTAKAPGRPVFNEMLLRIEANEAFATFHKFRNKEGCPLTLDEYPKILEVLRNPGQREALRCHRPLKHCRPADFDHAVQRF